MERLTMFAALIAAAAVPSGAISPALTPKNVKERSSIKLNVPPVII